MPIGKDSITKRVIGATETETATAAPKKRAPRKTAPKVQPAFNPDAVPTPVAPVETAPAGETPTAVTETAMTVDTAVMGNVSPEVVEKVTGHPEGKGEVHVKITDKMPNYLL